ncbi:MAG TPA: DUF695 domain-containing protein [Bacteroidia bacterium]|nr:DUF695 domain-containing protein [Bacteroidia bacterium]
MLKKFFGKKDLAIFNYADFWNWFLKNEKTFYEVIKSGRNPEKEFFNKLSPKLAELKDGFFYLAGMYDENMAEIVFTPDGVVKNVVFVEELVDAAPSIKNWKFTALKQTMDIEYSTINMAGYSFDRENLSFYAISHPYYPDEVDIVIVYDDFNEEDKDLIINGTYLFLDNFLGELNSITTIDNLTVMPKNVAEQELISIAKLKDYLIWREKEFVEKYSGIRHNTENDVHSVMEAVLQNDKPLVAMFNRDLLEWDSKASHPWILVVEIKYDGDDNNGMPTKEMSNFLNQLEEEIMFELKDVDGYLNIGRETADNYRTIYFACKEFRKPSKVIHEHAKKYDSSKMEFTYDIYKDKYWQSFERFRNA